jgi:hypothetical protein
LRNPRSVFNSGVLVSHVYDRSRCRESRLDFLRPPDGQHP